MTEGQMLSGLLEHFWINSDGGLEWSWKEGVGLNREDKALNEALIKYAKDKGIQSL